MFAPISATCFYNEHTIANELRWLLIGFAIGIFVVSIVLAVLITILGDKSNSETKTQKDIEHTPELGA